MADLGHREVSHESVVLANLEMAQAQFVLLVFERAFDGPACEGDVQEGFQGRSRRRIGEKVFFLARIERVTNVEKPIRAEDLAVAAEPKGSRLDFPDHRSLFGIFNVEPLPPLTQHDA